jgi:tyrosine-protein phosphatase SIW14
MEALGMFRTLITLSRAVTVLLALIIPGLVALQFSAQTRNLKVVREGILYRSGQMSTAGLRRARHDLGIKTVVSLREPTGAGHGAADLREEEFCKHEEIHYHRIILGKWYAEDGSTPAEQGIRRFREIMADPTNYPVLVHCLAGIHRTGACCAVYRMEQEHWTNAQAISEMKQAGYATLDDEWDILGYLEVYQPTWKQPKDQATVSRRPPAKPGVKQTRHSRRSESGQR